MTAEKVRALGQVELEAMLASAMDAVIAVDENHRIVLFNPAAEAMFGCAEADALGTSVERFIPERNRSAHAEHMRRFGEGAETTRRMGDLGRVHGLRTNGEEFPVEASIGTMSARGRRLYSVILRDVTIKNNTEVKLRESRRKLADFIGNIPGMAYLCLNGDRWSTEFVSDGCFSLTGYSEEELVNGNIAYGDLIHPEDRKSVENAVQAAIAQRVRFNVTYRIRTKGGATRWVSDQGVCVSNEHSTGCNLEGIATDISELRAAEEELRSSEERFRSLATNAAVGIFQTNEQGELEYVNPFWCELAGISAADALGTDCAQAFHPEERERLAVEWEERANVPRNQIPLSERRFLRPDGKETWVHGVAVPLRDPSGRVTGYLGTLVDLTERYHAEQATGARNEALQQLAAGASLEVVLSTLVRSVEDCFPHLRCSVLLHDEDERCLRHFAAASLPEFYTQVIDGLKVGDNAVFQRHRLVVEDVNTHHVWKNYRELTTLANIRACWSEPIVASDGHVLGVFVTYDRRPRLPSIDELDFVEATAHLARVAIEHHRNDELLKDRERRFRAVFNQRTELAKFLTPEGTLTDANARALDLLGVDLSEVVGRPLWESPWFEHDVTLQAKLRKAVAQAASGEFVRFEADHQRAGGKVAIIDFSLTPISDESGAVRMLFAEGVDITAAKVAKRQLKKSEQRAHEAEKLASIATLSAGIAHDIGAPLTAILGYAEMMQKSLPDTKNRRRAEIIIEQLNRITELVQSLLNMARPDERNLASVDLARVIEEAIDFYSEQMNICRIQVDCALTPVPVIIGDPNRLQQALLNLFVNAVDAMREGGTLRVSLTSTSEQIEIRIEDSGVGIPADDLEKIFEPFYTTKERGQGTGLGLLATKAIVEEHLGTISVESMPGRGATFTICLPLSEES